jgi:hypothetical protein
MRKDDMIRLLTAYCNFNTFKTVDEFSGDRMMTLEEGEQLLNWLQNKMGMKPPCVGEAEVQALHDIYIDPQVYRWDEEVDSDPKLTTALERRRQQFKQTED